MDLGSVIRRKWYRCSQNDSSGRIKASKDIKRQYSYDQASPSRLKKHSSFLSAPDFHLPTSSTCSSPCTEFSSPRLYSSKQLVEINEIPSLPTIPCRKSRELKGTVSRDRRSDRCSCISLTRPHTAPSIQVRKFEMKDHQENISFSNVYCGTKANGRNHKSANNLEALFSDRHHHLRKTRSCGTDKAITSDVIVNNLKRTDDIYSNSIALKCKIIDEIIKETGEAQVSAHPTVVSRATSPPPFGNESSKIKGKILRKRKGKRRRKHTSTKDGDPSRIEISTGEGVIINLEMLPGLSDRSQSSPNRFEEVNNLGCISCPTCCYLDSTMKDNRQNRDEVLTFIQEETLEKSVKSRKSVFFENTETGIVGSEHQIRRVDESITLRKRCASLQFAGHSTNQLEDETKCPLDLRKYKSNSKISKTEPADYCTVGIQVDQDLTCVTENKLRCDYCHEEIDGDDTEERPPDVTLQKLENVELTEIRDEEVISNQNQEDLVNHVKSNSTKTSPRLEDKVEDNGLPANQRSYTLLDLRSRFAFWKNLDSANLSPRRKSNKPNGRWMVSTANTSTYVCRKQSWNNDREQARQCGESCGPSGVICEEGNGTNFNGSAYVPGEIYGLNQCRCREHEGPANKQEEMKCVICRRSPLRGCRRKLPFCEELVNRHEKILKHSATSTKDVSPSHIEAKKSHCWRVSGSEHGWTPHSEDGPAKEVVFPKETRRAMKYLQKQKEGQAIGPGISNEGWERNEAVESTLIPYEKAKAVFQKAIANSEGPEGARCFRSRATQHQQCHCQGCNQISRCGN